MLFYAPFLFVGVFWGRMKMEYHREQCVMEGKLLGKQQNLVENNLLCDFDRRWGSTVEDRGVERLGVQRATKCHPDPKWHRNERIASVKEGAHSWIWAQLERAWKIARWIKLGRFGSPRADPYGPTCRAARKLREAAGQNLPIQAIGPIAARQASLWTARLAAEIHGGARTKRRVHSAGGNWAFKVSSGTPEKAHCLGADLA